MAMPALKAAEDAVNCISKGDIAELKNLGKPPADVKLVTMVVCILMEQPVGTFINPETQKKEKDYWKASVQMMMQPSFLDSLINFKRDDLT